MADHTSDNDENKANETTTKQSESENSNPTFDPEKAGTTSNTNHNKSLHTEESSSTMNNYSFVPRAGNILSPPRLAINPFAVKASTPTRSVADSTENKEMVNDFRPVLAPATFTPNRLIGDSENVGDGINSSSFKLKPAVLSNPFVKCDSVIEKQNNKQEVTTSKTGESSGNCSFQEVKNEVKTSPLAKTSSPSPSSSSVKEQQAAPDIDHDSISSTVASGLDHVVTSEGSLTSIQNSNPFKSVSRGSTSSSSDFVFGQNMNARVRNVNAVQKEVANSNGVAALTFSSNTSSAEIEPAAATAAAAENYANGELAKSKSLQESAQEYESRKIKRTYEEVAVVTGEEEESNVLQMNCKLFAFDKIASTWIERGRGLLRLNDRDEMQEGSLQSRLVMRTQGSLRVVLNTKIWAGMAVDKPNSKSVRITAMDKDSIKVFLVVASPKDAEQLHSALNWRVTTLKTTEDQPCENHSGEVQSCQPSTTSEESNLSPKRRRISSPDNFDDSNSSEYSANIQDMSIDSTSRSKPPPPPPTGEVDEGNSLSSSPSSL